MKSHFVYIIFSETKNIYYKGYSRDPKHRVDDHNLNKSRYTAHKGPWELVFYKSFLTKKEALQYELMLKRQNRSYLEWLIASDENEME